MDDSGSTLLLTIFYSALALAVILFAVSATSLYLERKRLFTVADGASLVGAEAFDLDQVTVDRTGRRPTLLKPQVAAAVDGYLRESPPDGFDRFRVVRATTVDGRSATVELAAVWHPPFVSVFVPAGVPIEVTSVARSVFS